MNQRPHEYNNLTVCPDHGDCRWYTHHPDRVGLDLDYGDGFRNGREFAQCHQPMFSYQYPVSDGRGDYFGLGFISGAVSEWCDEHDNCLATYKCRKEIEERLENRLTSST